MRDVSNGEQEVRPTAPVVRVAGALVVLLGLTNVVLAGIAAWTDSIRLAGSTDLVLGLLGGVTVVLGVLVALGRRWALVLALLVFGGLFVLQAFVATDGSTSTPAVVTLAVVVLPLVLALRATRAKG